MNFFAVVEDSWTHLNDAPTTFGEFFTEEAAIAASNGQSNQIMIVVSSKIGLLFIGPTEGNENSPNYGGPTWCVTLTS